MYAVPVFAERGSKALQNNINKAMITVNFLLISVRMFHEITW